MEGFYIYFNRRNPPESYGFNKVTVAVFGSSEFNGPSLTDLCNDYVECDGDALIVIKESKKSSRYEWGRLIISTLIYNALIYYLCYLNPQLYLLVHSFGALPISANWFKFTWFISNFLLPFPGTRNFKDVMYSDLSKLLNILGEPEKHNFENIVNQKVYQKTHDKKKLTVLHKIKCQN